MQRTVSLTTTLSRTWTSRGGTDPEWLFSVNRASRTDVPSPDMRTTPSQTLGDIERTGSPKGDFDKGPFGDQVKAPVSSARSSLRQQISRAASVNVLPETIIEGNADERSPTKRSDLEQEGGGEAAGFGYAALHEARENEGVSGARGLGDEGKLEKAAEEEAPRTVRFLDHSSSAQEVYGDGSRQIHSTEDSGTKQVQFVQ